MQNGTKERSDKHQNDYFQMISRFCITQQKHSQQVCKDIFVPKLHIKKQTKKNKTFSCITKSDLYSTHYQ